MSLQFILDLNIGGTVEDYRDVAAVLRNLADELDEPDLGREDGAWEIAPVEGGRIYEDNTTGRPSPVIGRWRVAEVEVPG
jgi:hypothetical protein